MSAENFFKTHLVVTDITVKEFEGGNEVNSVHLRTSGDRDLFALVDALTQAIAPKGEAAGVTMPRELAESLLSHDDCSLDHHGGCQTHNNLEPEPGETCPQAVLKALLTRETP